MIFIKPQSFDLSFIIQFSITLKKFINIQIINLVTPDSIEQDMLGKLRFKTSMFEGVLDDGEDSVFITDDKFSNMMETVNGMVEEDEEDESSLSSDKYFLCLRLCFFPPLSEV